MHSPFSLASPNTGQTIQDSYIKLCNQTIVEVQYTNSVTYTTKCYGGDNVNAIYWCTKTRQNILKGRGIANTQLLKQEMIEICYFMQPQV